MTDEFELEIDWIPEDTGAPYTEVDMLEANETIAAHTADKICMDKFGHKNWVRMDRIHPSETTKNPCEIDYEAGIVYFKNEVLI
tara:strand:- start:1437 stop:1688 length:252 start_codon:yes stop_codon:yes gene_type:complete